MKTQKKKIEFSDLEFEDMPKRYEGIQAIHEFKNGYGVSVVRHNFSYGGDAGLYEVAVLKDGGLCYDTAVADDVIGWCDEEKVTEILQQVSRLKKAKK